jgi:hypothetical protein
MRFIGIALVGHESGPPLVASSVQFFISNHFVAVGHVTPPGVRLGCSGELLPARHIPGDYL